MIKRQCQSTITLIPIQKILPPTPKLNTKLSGILVIRILSAALKPDTIMIKRERTKFLDHWKLRYQPYLFASQLLDVIE